MKLFKSALHVLVALSMLLGASTIVKAPEAVQANNTTQTLPFSQDWGDGTLLTTTDDWSPAPGIIGYLGDYLPTGSSTGVNPQTLLADYTSVQVDLIANQTDASINNGGVAEFVIGGNTVVALQGSGTADAPYLVLFLSTTGYQDIAVSYKVQDLDGTADNSIQQVALHYRTAGTGDFTNVSAAYIADATSGPSATMETPISVTLPTAANNQAVLQLRIMTTNAVGNDEWVGIDDISVTGTPLAGDTAPTVASTLPANSGTLNPNGDIAITFSEAVTVADGWFSISCSVSGAHAAVVTDADPLFTLNPDVNFVGGETCTVTVDHTKVNDDDLDDTTADYMLADHVFSFSVLEGCGDAYTATYNIQGSGPTSPLVGNVVTTEGVVVGDFQVGGKAGYFIQELTPDSDPLTSEGLFIYNTSVAVNVGDRVRVKGTVSEYVTGTGGTLTQVTPSAPAASNVQICSTGGTVTPTTVTLPVTSLSDFEKFEGMLVTFPQSLIISEYFNFDRFGEIVLTSLRHSTPTAIVEPGPSAALEEAAYLLDRITLDDGRTSQNPDPARHPNGADFTMTNLFRGGGTVTDVTGVLDFYQSLYRVQPTAGATYQDANPRTPAPDIEEGDLKIASFNVLNYFVTFTSEGSVCGPSGNMDCRGADNATEFTRQKDKIIAAMAIIDADVFGLMEIENEHSGGGNAVADLVDGLNAVAGPGTYSYIHTGAIGTDAIKQAIIYKPLSVTPLGDFELLTSAADPRFIDTLNRPALAQTFTDILTGQTFTVAVNHLKSKGSACTGDPDMGDGQGNCNLTRKAAAEALVDWLADDTIFPAPQNSLIIGDLNSYAKEDPIDAIRFGADNIEDTADDYGDMLSIAHANPYGYVFDGRVGYLDHALVNYELLGNVVDVNFWHINADEADLINYDTSFKLPAQDALYASDAYRSSDHDPVIITLQFSPEAHDDTYVTNESTTLVKTALEGVLANDYDTEDDDLTAMVLIAPLHGDLVLDDDGSFTYTPFAGFNGVDSFVYIAHDTVDYDIATVFITVNSINYAPIGLSDTYTTAQDAVLTVPASGVLTNDADLDGDPLTAELVVNVTHGTLTLAANGSFVYTPNTGFFGEDSFTYKAFDGALYSGETTVKITVTRAGPFLFDYYLPVVFR